MSSSQIIKPVQSVLAGESKVTHVEKKKAVGETRRSAKVKERPLELENLG